jgi:hypothetical protein
MPWREALRVAHEDPTPQSRQLGANEAEENRDWLTTEHVAYVLRVVALRLDADSLTEEQYEAERENLLAEAEARHLHEHRLRLPKAAQIRISIRTELYGTRNVGTPQVGTWNRALELAGLKPPRPPQGEDVPTQPLLPLDLLDRYYDAHGAEPTPGRLWRFAGENELPYAVIRGKEVWSRVIQKWRKEREARGLPAPKPPKPVTEGENSLTMLRVGGVKDRGRRGSWNDQDKCLKIIIKYLEQLPPGSRATFNGYKTWAKQQSFRTPYLSALDKHGGWSKMRDLAHQQMLKQLKAGERTTNDKHKAKSRPINARPAEPAPASQARLTAALYNKSSARSTKPRRRA